MGLEQSRGMERHTNDEAIASMEFPKGLKMAQGNYACDSLNKFSIFPEDDPDKKYVQDRLFKEGGFDIKTERCLAVLLGLAVGDSLGSPLEFSPVRYGSTEVTDIDQPEVWNNPRYNRFQMRPGQWTDDASMALCLADSLLSNGTEFNPRDLRLRFINWWRFGYNNAFGYDDERMGGSSVGLGGNISQSMSEFMQEGNEYTKAGTLRTSGNGSIMRNGPVPIFYHHNRDLGEQTAYKQSKCTHQGDEAAQCARLLTHITINAINFNDVKEEPRLGKKTKAQYILDGAADSFKSDFYSAMCLAKGVQEDRHPENKDLDLEDRNWTWRDPDYKFSPSRSRQQPGYIGSYAMDGLGIALHCVYSTNSFSEAILKCANLRGDCDTTCAITAQMAGAIYGLGGAFGVPEKWIKCVQQWDNGGTIAMRAYKLATYHSRKEEQKDGAHSCATTNTTADVSTDGSADAADVLTQAADEVESKKDAADPA